MRSYQQMQHQSELRNAEKALYAQHVAKQRVRDSIESYRDLVNHQISELVRHETNTVRSFRIQELILPKWHEEPRNY
jgi:DNA-dependent RNA polymerase auxiliary subunit epsilon